jgi:hypothetical protein
MLYGLPTNKLQSAHISSDDARGAYSGLTPYKKRKWRQTASSSSDPCIDILISAVQSGWIVVRYYQDNLEGVDWPAEDPNAGAGTTRVKRERTAKQTRPRIKSEVPSS